MQGRIWFVGQGVNRGGHGGLSGAAGIGWVWQDEG